jgi:hypothetical protein
VSKTPPIPNDQANHIGAGAEPSPVDRKSDIKHDPSRDQSGLNLNEQGAAGNLRQNLTHSRNVQDR